MDSTQDLLLGVLTGTQYVFRYPGVEAYLVSIKRSGFKGRKVMLVWDINPATRQKLLDYGFEVVDILPWPPERFFHARMRLAWEYLRDHSQEFRYVFWLDIKDLVLQSDPSVWMEQHIGDAKLIGSTECVTIEQEETNQLWARSILGEEKYEEIKDEEVINGGTWAGESETMKEVFHQVHLGCKGYSGNFPPCQIWINYVMRKPEFKPLLKIPRWSEGFAACLHPCWSPWRMPCWPNMRDPHPVLNSDGYTLHAGTTPDPTNKMIMFNGEWGTHKPLNVVSGADPLQGVECVKNPKGKVFSIVHGYDRDWTVKSVFEYKYSFQNDIVNEHKVKEYIQALCNASPRRRSLNSGRFGR